MILFLPNRALYNAGYRTVAAIASATWEEIALHMRNALPFQSKKNSSQAVRSAKVERRIARLIVTNAQKILGECITSF